MFDSKSSWRSSRTTSSKRPSSSPAQIRRTPSECVVTQAQLMRERGDLENGRGRFCVKLPKVRPIVRSQQDGPTAGRIGMNVSRDNCKSGLVVVQADHGLQKKTPVAQLNKEEERQAERDEAEVHASYAIRPGDRIREIHAEDFTKTLKNLGQCHAEQDEEPGMDKKTMSASAMLAELDLATSETSPRVVNLAVSRNLENVLRPCTAPNRSRPPSAASAPENVTPPPLVKRGRSASLSSIAKIDKSRTPPKSSDKRSLVRGNGKLQASPVIIQHSAASAKLR